MSKLTEGTRVVSIEANSLRKGTVKKMYEDLNIAIVDYDDGGTEKVSLSMLAIEPEPIKEENVQEKKESKIIEKSEITITPDEFREIASTIITEESKKCGPLLISLGSILLAKIHTALFVELKND